MRASRRAVLGAGLAGAVALVSTPGAMAAPRPLRSARTTVIVSPHQDDETLYTAGYTDWARACGDDLVLLQVTDGGATKAKAEGWRRSDLVTIRNIEQEAAWRALTAGRGTIIRLELPDGGRGSLTDPVCEAVRSLDGPDVEFYVAANDGQSLDHVAVVKGVRTSGARVARFANPPGSKTGYYYPPVDPEACRVAAGCYVAVGYRSVPRMFLDLASSGYASRVTP